eukprot:TRINITY_DN96424_c0_g1_i1.p1 TRINITY_DN96424_c0_g1~~TRINITY_DN96424_c0_g1_i1.p1  ORF type:complete len:112 (-),score=31.91 TRINITY_DN96424_c0_g1_i1:50-385(-)
MPKHTGRKHRRDNKKTKSSVIAKKRRSKDIDQVHDDLKVPQKFAPGELPMDEDLPGMGQYYCICCTRYFATKEVLKQHEKSKLHKRRLAKAKDDPHTQKDADAAVGYSTER